MAQVRVGISGWTYAPWRGVFYPVKLKQKAELAFAASRVTSIEINGTFYRLQTPETFRAWRDQTPASFCFAVKATQFITHRRRLKDVAQPLANFFASGILELGEKLGPILWQFPPSLPLVDDRFAEFMAMLPRDARAAAALAERHDAFVEGRASTSVKGDFPVRHAFEFRHASFADADFHATMRRHNVALVIADAGEHAVEAAAPTADFIYVRMHGQDPRFADGYTEDGLAAMAARVTAWAQDPKVPRDVYVYFDNDAKAHAPRNALRLLELLEPSRLRQPPDPLDGTDAAVLKRRSSQRGSRA